MSEELRNKIIVCKDCKRKFPFTIEDQKYFGQKGYPDPIRCLYCRRQKRILNLRDGVGIADEIKFSEVCDKCGRSFYTKFKRKPGERIYCDDCWKEIKFVNPNREKDKNVAESEAEIDKRVS